MASHRISSEARASVVRLWADEGVRSERRISRATGLHWLTVRRILRGAGLKTGPLVASETGRKQETPAPAAPQSFTREESADAARIDFTSDTRIRTVEDAIAYAEVDTSVWRVDRFETTSWEVVLKVKRLDDKGKVVGETPIRKTMWRVKLYLRRILPRPLADATEAIFERMKAYSPKYHPAPARRPPSDPHMLTVGIFDAHFAKLAWGAETGTNYDLKIAEAVYRHAVEDLLDSSAGFPVEKILLPIGNDFFHVDNHANTTTAGTPQDTDGRYAKIYETGFMSVVWAIERLRQHAPVDVTWIPGNHDRTISYHLAKEVATWFRLCDDVNVDYGPRVRKYHRYGTTLLGMTHGNLEKHSSLPVIMATERKVDWAETTTREWYLGHKHTSKRVDTVGTDTEDGVTLRTLRSLSGTDFWHFSKGYLSTQRAAEAFVYGRDSGFAGHFNVNVRE